MSGRREPGANRPSAGNYTANRGIHEGNRRLHSAGNYTSAGIYTYRGGEPAVRRKATASYYINTEARKGR